MLIRKVRLCKILSLCCLGLCVMLWHNSLDGSTRNVRTSLEWDSMEQPTWKLVADVTDTAKLWISWENTSKGPPQTVSNKELEKLYPSANSTLTTASHSQVSQEKAVIQTTFENLFKQMRGINEYSWMLKRIERMIPLWKKAVTAEFPSPQPHRIKKRIHVHPGLLAWGLAKGAGNGAPVGELVQWSDILASLHLIGHDVVLTRTLTEVKNLYESKPWPFDLIYTDIIGYKEVFLKLFADEKIPDALKCRIRVVDTWGTEADFNVKKYADRRGRKVSFYGGLEIDLRQFNTLYPHSPDNTFMGFVIEKVKTNDTLPDEEKPKRDIALLYAKTQDLLDDQYRYIDIIKEYFPEIHATIGGGWKKKPAYVTNNGVLSQDKFAKLLRRTKIFVGFGSPYEGPGALEAIQLGAVFFNRRIVRTMADRKNPTARILKSQNTYAETIGKPHVYTFDIKNETAVREALEEVKNSPDPGNYLAFEFSARGMLQRVSVLVEKQQFCNPICWDWKNITATGNCAKVWPPLSSLKLTVVSNTQDSCNEACSKNGYICEPTFFPLLNRKEAFARFQDKIQCDRFESPTLGEMEYPALDFKPNDTTCYLQSDKILFSCAGNYLHYFRLCPCRDYVPQQSALCKKCTLT